MKVTINIIAIGLLLCLLVACVGVSLLASKLDAERREHDAQVKQCAEETAERIGTVLNFLSSVNSDMRGTKERPATCGYWDGYRVSSKGGMYIDPESGLLTATDTMVIGNEQ